MELNNGKVRLGFVPEIGGSIVDFSANPAGLWIPVMRRGEDPLSKSSNACGKILGTRAGKALLAGEPPIFKPLIGVIDTPLPLVHLAHCPPGRGSEDP